MSEATAPASIPSCPKCDGPMVRRTTRRGPNAGNEFWGCSEFPRCRGIRREGAPAETETAESTGESASADAVPGTAGETGGTDGGDKPDGFLTKVVKVVDKGWRRYLESDEPDAAGRWDDDHRRRMLKYIYTRDDRRCGLCAGEMKLEGAQIEHIVPKVFVLFDIGKGGKAQPGTFYRNRLHKIDNLQAAHTYCNKRKGNAPEVSKWRHPAMPPLTVADTEDGETLVVPQKPAARSTN